ncbi:MAG: SIMPL domain-containing protein [Sphingomonas sp.]
MRFKLLAAMMIAVPAIATAQPAARQAVTVEIVATGTIDAPASWYTLAVTYSVSGEDSNAAKKAQDAKQDAIRAAVQKAGLPASALTFNPPEPVANPVTVTTDEGADAKPDDKAEPEPKPMVVISDGASIRVTTLDQAAALRTAFEAIDVQVAAPQAELADPDAVHRLAKAKALTVARGDADAYGRELGLRVLRVDRISEAGNGLFMPGLQGLMQRAMSGGPRSMQALFQSKPGTVRIDETIIVGFVLAP